MPTCERCGESNSERARFCQACGQPLDTAPAGREERKIVSVLFVDLVGFTARSDDADPEDVRAMLQPYHARVRDEIERFGGVVEKFIGDAIMAVFGAPLAHGDDAERAVRAGLRVLEAVQELNLEHPTLELTLRAAVNSGEAVAAIDARADRGEALVAGDVVNTASRLQAAAPSGSLVVGAETFRTTRNAILYGPLAPISVKGKREPLEAWIALEPLLGPSVRPASGGPILGRDRELDLVSSIWRRVVTEQRAHVVTVLGPPGIGKTRLSDEVAAVIGDEGNRIVRGRCLPYGETTGYGAFAQQIKELSAILETDPPDIARTKLLRLVSETVEPGETAEVSQHLSLLLGLGSDEEIPDRQPLFYSARRFVEELARKLPTVFVFEDVHWADRSLLDLLESLASRVRDAPALFFALARPEFLDTRPGWGAGLVAHTTIQLEPLTDAESVTLAARFLPSPDLPPSTTERLIAAAGGNPLFIEELATALSEGTGVEGPLPTSIKTTIAARIDALPAPARTALLDASIVGKTFWRGVLASMEPDVPVDDALESLEARDLIRREPLSQLEGDREFAFKHMLIRDVAYETLPRATRRNGHAACARFIEASAGERIAESAPIHAYHWREAGDRDAAIRYLILGAEHAGHGWAKTEMLELYHEALLMVDEQDTALRLDLSFRQALARLELGDYAIAADELDAIIDRLDGRDRLAALIARARCAYWVMDPVGARYRSELAVAEAERLDDGELLGPALAMLSHAHSMAGDMDNGFAIGDRALEVWLPSAPAAELAAHLEQHALHYYWTGQYAQAVDYADRALELAMEISSVESLLRAGATKGMALTGLGRHEEALPLLDRIVAEGRELELHPRWTARALNMSTPALRDLFQLEESRRRSEEASELGRRAGFPLAEIQAGIDVLFDDLVAGDVERAHAAWAGLWEETQITKGWHQWLMTCRLAAARATIAAELEPVDTARAAALEAIEVCRSFGRLKYETAARAALVTILMRSGKAEQAIEEAQIAVARAESLAHPPTSWMALAQLARASYAVGDDDAASDAFRQADARIEAFASNLTDEHRSTLLSAPHVRNIRAASA